VSIRWDSEDVGARALSYSRSELEDKIGMAFAVTINRSQGRTVDWAGLLGQAVKSETTLVGASRAREVNAAYFVSATQRAAWREPVDPSKEPDEVAYIDETNDAEVASLDHHIQGILNAQGYETTAHATAETQLRTDLNGLLNERQRLLEWIASAPGEEAVDDLQADEVAARLAVIDRRLRAVQRTIHFTAVDIFPDWFPPRPDTILSEECRDWERECLDRAMDRMLEADQRNRGVATTRTRFVGRGAHV
jgi:hypothetical protein